MKRYIRADANYFTIKSWVNTPYSYPADVDYVVIEHMNGDFIWEGHSWDLPEEYYPLNIQDEEYDGAGLCIITVK